MHVQVQVSALLRERCELCLQHAGLTKGMARSDIDDLTVLSDGMSCLPHQGAATGLLRMNPLTKPCLTPGSVIFSDTTYPKFTQQAKVQGQLPPRHYIWQPDAPVRVLVTNLVDQSQGAHPHL